MLKNSRVQMNFMSLGVKEAKGRSAGIFHALQLYFVFPTETVLMD